MVIIPEKYYKKKLKVELTAYEIEQIIEELEQSPYNTFNLFGYNKIIEKLKKVLNSGGKNE